MAGQFVTQEEKDQRIAWQNSETAKRLQKVINVVEELAVEAKLYDFGGGHYVVPVPGGVFNMGVAEQVHETKYLAYVFVIEEKQ